MSGAALGWVFVVALAAVPIVVTAVASLLRKRGIWTAGKDDDRHRGGGGGAACGGGGGCGGGAACGGGGGCGGGGD